MSERNLDFDKVIPRRNTKCLKYDFAEKRGYPKDVLPLWVADMDFKTSSYIEDALVELAHHNIFGYTNDQPGDGFFEAVAGWMKRHHGWKVEQEWHVKTPGVVFAIAAAIRGLTAPGDGVIIQQPVYYPFADIIKVNNRRLVVSELKADENGHYVMDLWDFEERIEKENVKLFILCNPHNPVGRAWTKDELLRIGGICARHGVTVFSDEIHSDFVWKDEHIVFQELREDFKEFTLTATAPSKTFNLAGLQQSNIFVPNAGLRKRLIRAIAESGYDEPNAAGLTAAQAAYTHGDVWYDAVRRYIRGNLDYLQSFVIENIPGAVVSETEATYLAWIDLNRTGLTPAEINDRVVYRAGLWLDRGGMFGPSGEGFERINAACPRSVLKEALERLAEAFQAS
ncbi:MAG: pyridoxal phosphate-dependent aminotransferase [Lachnospiraceae bacterium]|nr:pyridoxal phosphate-dependent aminotransferase [Lachnospiraceae bacterium]